MKLLLTLCMVGLVLGTFIGLPMGVVGYGTGWSGSVIFGPIGAVIGLLVGLVIRR